MGLLTKIQWCHHTFNPWIGCTKVSAGCANCYAEALMDKRWGKVSWGKGNKRQRTSKSNWLQPRRWDKAAKEAGERRRVFCSSLADILDEEVEQTWRNDLAALIDDTPNLDWLLLTKRPENIKLWPSAFTQWPNVWWGTSAEDQETADLRIPKLLNIAGTVRFVSYEPALGPVDFSTFLFASGVDGEPAPRNEPNQPKLHWIIVGGESGPHARPFEIRWAHSTIQQCRAAGVACFVKQLGASPVDASLHVSDDPSPLVDRKGGNMSEWPEDLRVREFPSPLQGERHDG